MSRIDIDVNSPLIKAKKEGEEYLDEYMREMYVSFTKHQLKTMYQWANRNGDMAIRDRIHKALMGK